MNTLEIANKLKLNKTCSMCPEQYDVYFNGEYVGYIRLRSGVFSVEYGLAREVVYKAHISCDGYLMMKNVMVI